MPGPQLVTQQACVAHGSDPSRLLRRASCPSCSSVSEQGAAVRWRSDPTDIPYRASEDTKQFDGFYIALGTELDTYNTNVKALLQSGETKHFDTALDTDLYTRIDTDTLGMQQPLEGVLHSKRKHDDCDAQSDWEAAPCQGDALSFLMNGSGSIVSENARALVQRTRSL